MIILSLQQGLISEYKSKSVYLCIGELRALQIMEEVYRLYRLVAIFSVVCLLPSSTLQFSANQIISSLQLHKHQPLGNICSLLRDGLETGISLSCSQPFPSFGSPLVQRQHLEIKERFLSSPVLTTNVSRLLSCTCARPIFLRSLLSSSDLFSDFSVLP